MQALAVNWEHFGRGCDEWFKLVCELATCRCVGFFKFIDDKDFGFQLLTPLGIHGIVIHDASVFKVIATDSPYKWRPEGILA